MNSHLSRDNITYTGDELRSLWIYRKFGIVGDAIVAFVGACDVDGERLVDQVDAAAGDSIKAASMMHFLIEHFPSPSAGLAQAVLRQRLLVCLAAEILRGQVADFRRVGDDLFVGERKLSVSIATVSPVSSLVHFAVNIDPTGAPVAACGLGQLGIDPWPFAEALLAGYVSECESMEAARCTVRGVP